jgi:hypothetical protein
MEDDVYAHHGTCTRERTGSVLYGSGFCRNEAFGAKRKSRSIGLSQFRRLRHLGGVLLPQWPSKESEA